MRNLWMEGSGTQCIYLSKLGRSQRLREIGQWEIPNWWVDHVHAKSLHSCPTFRIAMDCSPPGSSVHGIFQARILWVAMPSSRLPISPEKVLEILNQKGWSFTSGKVERDSRDSSIELQIVPHRLEVTSIIGFARISTPSFPSLSVTLTDRFSTRLF